MSAVAADLLTTIKARSPEERDEILQVLIEDALARKYAKAPSGTDAKCPLGYLLSNQCQLVWDSFFSDPTNMAELNRRFDSKEKGLTMEELIEKLENA